MEKLSQLLNEINPNVDFASEKSLVSDGILDSMDIITIVNMLIDEYNCDIDLSDLEPENMDSIEAIYELVKG